MRRVIFLKVLVVVVCFIGITMTSALGASPPAPGIQERLVEQHKRIEEGINSRKLTQDEAKVLRDNLNYIQQEEKRLAAVGKLTYEERVKLHKMLDQNSRMILKIRPVGNISEVQ